MEVILSKDVDVICYGGGGLARYYDTCPGLIELHVLSGMKIVFCIELLNVLSSYLSWIKH
jgi:hypothetical protein